MPSVRHHRVRGFTFLELLVVLAIIVLITVVALPRFTTKLARQEPQMVSFLRAERAHAASARSVNAVFLDGNEFVSRRGANRLALGSDVEVEWPDANRERSASVPLTPPIVTTFFADGTMTAARLILRSSTQAIEISLSPLSGITYRPAP